MPARGNHPRSTSLADGPHSTVQPTLPNAVALFRSLASGDNTAYVLSDGLRIIRVNEAWTKFARANGGEGMLDRCGRG